MSDEWNIDSAHIVPNATFTTEEKEDMKLPILSLEKDDIIAVENSTKEDFLTQVVSTSQPSDDWPSDHFMVVVKASF